MLSLNQCHLKGLLVTTVVLSTNLLSPSAWAIDCDDRAQIVELFDVIAQRRDALPSRQVLSASEYWVRETPEYETLQICGETILPIVVEYTASELPGFDSTDVVLSAFWQDYADAGMMPLLDAFNQAETELEQVNLIEAIATITETHRQLQSVPLTDSMLTALEHPNSEVRVTAVQVLASFANPELVQPIAAAIINEPRIVPVPGSRQRSISARNRMTSALVNSPTARMAIPEILDLIRTAPDWDVYAGLISALDLLISEADPHFEDAINLLANSVLNDSREAAAFNAAMTLGEFGAAAQPVLPKLLEALKKTDLDASAQRQLPRTLVQIGEDLITDIDTLEQADIDELLRLYEQALESVMALGLDNEAEQRALAEIIDAFK